MKKYISFLLAAILVLSLFTSTALATGALDLSSRDEAKQAILERIDDAYSGVTAAGGGMCYMQSTEGDYAVLVFKNADDERYIRFVGSAATDGNGGVTVTDDDTGYGFRFIPYAQDDGSYLLDCGSLGECYMEPADPDDTASFVVDTFLDMIDATGEFMDTIPTYEEQKDALLEIISSGYYGKSASGESIIYFEAPASDFGGIVIEDAAETSYVKFIGGITVADDGVITINDNQTGYSLGFLAQAQEDGSFVINCGSLGEYHMELVDSAEIANYLVVKTPTMLDNTDAHMAQVAASADAPGILRSKDGRFIVELPTGWAEDNTLSEEADLQASNDRAMACFMLLTESKEAYTFEAWRGGILSYVTKRLDDYEITDLVDVAVQGYPATQQTLKCTIDGTNFVYLLTCIDGESYYGYSICFAVDFTYESNVGAFEEIIASIQGL